MKPDLILTSDWHLREDRPLCRTDDYWSAMWAAVGFIRELQSKYNSCPILHGGDLFNKAKPSLYLASLATSKMPRIFISAGQHDLPNHNYKLAEKSGLVVTSLQAKTTIIDKDHHFTLDNFKVHIEGVDYGDKLENKRKMTNMRRVLLIHTLVTETESAAKLMGGISAKALMDKMSGYDLIVSGDNHMPFTYEQDGRLLVNPGSMMRMSADQIDHKPRVYLWYAETNTVEPVYLPIEQGVISREHIEKKEDRDKKIKAFVTHLNEDYKTGVDFEGNLKEYFRKHRTKRAVETMTWEAIG
jgi:DNA repair exonuclease SbcCD nuclease subunit